MSSKTILTPDQVDTLLLEVRDFRQACWDDPESVSSREQIDAQVEAIEKLICHFKEGGN